MGIIGIGIMIGVMQPGRALKRTVTGLLLSEDFSAPSGWTSGGVFATDSTRPSYVCFDRSGTIALSPGATTDAGGVREGAMLIDDDGKWYLYNGSGDGTSGAGGPWRPQVSYSLDRGATWTHYGSMGIDLRKDETPAHGNWAARDLLAAEKRGSIYYLYVMSALNVSADNGLNVVPAQPYRSDIFTATNPLGPWTWQAQTCDIGAGGAIDENANYAGFNYLDSATYRLFTSVIGGGGGTFHISVSTASSILGPYTKSGVSVLPAAIEGTPENPKVWFSTALNRYVMTCNQINQGASVTDKNSAFYSGSVTDWTLAKRLDFQRICPADAGVAVGIWSPFVNSSGVMIDAATGIVPGTFDADPVPNNVSPYHLGRKLRYAQLEPSAWALRYDPSQKGSAFADNFNRADGALGATWNLLEGHAFAIVSNRCSLIAEANPNTMNVVGQSIANGYITSTINFQSGSGIGLVMRAVDKDNYMLMDFSDNVLNVYKKVTGSYTQIGAPHGITLPASADNTVSCVFIDSVYWVYVNGTLVLTLTDSTFTSAGLCGLRNGSAGGGTRFADNFSVTSFDGAPTTYRKALIHSDCSIEFSPEFVNIGSDRALGVDFRIQSNGDGYRLVQDNAGALQFQTVTGGVAANIGSSSGTVGAISSFAHRVKITAIGTALKAYLDGELQAQATDATWSAGVKIGVFASPGADGLLRLLHVRKSDTVTVIGVTPGQVVTLRGFGDFPLVSATAVSTSVTLTTTHYPAHSVSVDGALYTVGSIYGGDTLAVS